MSSQEVKRFYDSYWPANLPDYEATARHVKSLVPEGQIDAALDGGCGTGVCSLALAGLAVQVTAVDISNGSLRTAKDLADKCGVSNIHFQQGDLLGLPFEDGSFDLVWSWGVIHHTVDPWGAFTELVRVLKPGGHIVLAVYLKTLLTPLHEAVRRRCLRMSPGRKRSFLRRISGLTDAYSRITGKRPLRDDNRLTTSKIEDWYFVPEKHFFSIAEAREMFESHGMSFELRAAKTGRFKSTSNFIVTGRKRPLLEGANLT